MSSNAALSAARRRRSNPAPVVSTNIPQTNRILQRSAAPPPMGKGQNPHPQSSSRIQQPPQPMNSRMPAPPLQQQHQFNNQTRQPQSQSRLQQTSTPVNNFPPLPPPVKNAGPLYGIPIHPLMMFKTHDNKLNEHDISIGDCVEHLKEIDERLALVEGIKGEESNTTGGEEGAGDLNELINDVTFINGVVDNIMNTTNLASMVEDIIPLKEENEILKQQVKEMNEKIHNLEERFQDILQMMSISSAVAASVAIVEDDTAISSSTVIDSICSNDANANTVECVGDSGDVVKTED